MEIPSVTAVRPASGSVYPDVVADIVPDTVCMFVRVYLGARVVLLIMEGLSITVSAVARVVVGATVVPVLPFVVRIGKFLFPGTFASLFFSLVLLCTSYDVLRGFFLVRLIFSRLSGGLTYSCGAGIVARISGLQRFA